MKYLLFVVFILEHLTLVAQNPTVDSLLRIVNSHKGDSTEVDALNELGDLFHHNGSYDSSLLFHRRALSLATLRGYSRKASDAHQGISVNLLWLSKYDSAKFYLSKAETIAKKNKDYADLAGIYNSLGNILLQEGNNTEALRNYILTAKIQDSLVHDPLGQSRALANIGNIQYHMGNFDKALSYAKEAQKISAENNLGKNLAYTSQLIGRILRKEKKLDQSLIEYEKALAQYLKMGLKREACETYLSIGNVYFDKRDFSNAQKSYKVAVKISKEISNDPILGIIYSAIGIAFQNLKNYQSAISYMDSAYRVGKKINDQYTVLDSYEVLSQVYASKKMYKEALDYFNKFTNLKDSLSQSENKSEIEELEMKYQNQKKVAEIELLKSEQSVQALALSKQRSNTFIIIIVLISVIIISILLINRYRVIGRSKRLIELERMRNDIARDLHDDIGSTLSSINIMSQLAMKEKGNSSDRLQKIASYSASMMDTMSDMVWSINPRNDSVEQMLAKMKEFAGEILEPKNIQYEFINDGQVENVKLDVEKRKNLFLIFKEALNNAAKYSEATKVKIQLTQMNGLLHLTVQDNGKGFDASVVVRGNGLKNMAERAQGISGIWKQESIPGDGTVVIVQIPVT